MLDLAASCVSAMILWRAMSILNKMTRFTAHIPRMAMISVAVASFYSMVSPLYGEQDIAHPLFIMVGAGWLLADRRKHSGFAGDCKRAMQ